MWASLRGIIAPEIAHELKLIYKDAPMIIFGVTPLLAGLLTLLLPETTNEDLPDTLEEGERFGKDQSLLPTICHKTSKESEERDHE